MDIFIEICFIGFLLCVWEYLMSDDLIKRADAVEILEHMSACKEYGIEIGTDEETYIGKYEAITAISDLPSADRPQGKNLSEEYPFLFECSVCGASCSDTIPWDCDINFCPNCGCRIKGADDE